MQRRAGSQSWDAVAGWYAKHAGRAGSAQHRSVAIPLMMDLLRVSRSERIADIGCGPGVLTPAVLKAGGQLVGVDLSPRLIAAARRLHGRLACFVVGDATSIAPGRELQPRSFDAAAFLLSLQDIDPLEGAIRSAARLLKPDGRIAMVLTHPCFRVPRQSGWGWDEGRALQFRRVDSYLTRLAAPIKPHESGDGSTRSYHRPLADYAAALEAEGFALTAIREAAGLPREGSSRAMRRAMAEFPMFLGLRAERRLIGPPRGGGGVCASCPAAGMETGQNRQSRDTK